MKIRLGHVSNSSSTSFTVPAFLLTDEQKEMLLSMDDMKETKAQLMEYFGPDAHYDMENSKNDYPVNEEYHRIYKEMIEAGEWHDMGWSMGEDKKKNTISGSTEMWNGTIEKFMEKIGIDPTMIEIVNEGHRMVHMATHPDAIKHQIWLHGEWLKWWEKESKIDREFDILHGMKPTSICPYSLSDDKFEPLGTNSLQYEEPDDPEDDYQDTYSYVKDKKDEV